MARRPDRPKKNRPSSGEPTEKYEGESDEEAPPAWLTSAAARYEERQQGYASLLAGAREAVEKDKERLSEMLAKNDEPSEDDPPPPPPIFDEAARAYQERQKSLGGLFSDAVKAKQQERDALSQMFGPRTGKKPPRR